MRSAAACVLIALSTGAAAPPAVLPQAAAAAAFDPIAFFDGHTEGNGRLKVMMARTRTVHVLGEGRTAADGALTLVQQVEQEGKDPRTRQWRLRRVGGGRYAGELSDAVGPVTVDSIGDRLHIRFNGKGGLGIEQWLSLQPGGTVVQNHLVVHKLGVRVATLDETIRKID